MFEGPWLWRPCSKRSWGGMDEGEEGMWAWNCMSKLRCFQAFSKAELVILRTPWFPGTEEDLCLGLAYLSPTLST